MSELTINGGSIQYCTDVELKLKNEEKMASFYYAGDDTSARVALPNGTVSSKIILLGSFSRFQFLFDFP